MAHLSPWENKPKIAIACSGGPDSLALLGLAHHWVQQQGGTVLVLHVDHGLRPESAAEAAFVAQFCAQHGWPCQILHWQRGGQKAGVPDTKRSHAAARAARYHLLQKACVAENVLHLLTAHHANDVAETVALRAEKQQSGIGLAGMSALRAWPQGRILRPLLHVPQAELQAYIKQQAWRAIDDPSNRNLRYARARVRQAGVEIKNLSAAIAQRQSIEANLAQQLLSAEISPHGWLMLPQNILSPTLLRQLLWVVSGAEYPPALAQMPDFSKITSFSKTISLAGCLLQPLFRPIGGEKLRILREPVAAARSVIELQPNIATLWDGRFMVQSPVLAQVRALGTRPTAQLLAIAPDLLRKVPQGRARASLPAFFVGGQLVAIGAECDNGHGFKACWAPRQSLAGHGFVASTDLAMANS